MNNTIDSGIPPELKPPGSNRLGGFAGFNVPASKAVSVFLFVGRALYPSLKVLVSNSTLAKATSSNVSHPSIMNMSLDKYISIREYHRFPIEINHIRSNGTAATCAMPIVKSDSVDESLTDFELELNIPAIATVVDSAASFSAQPLTEALS